MQRPLFFLTLIFTLGLLAFYFNSYPAPSEALLPNAVISPQEDQELYEELSQTSSIPAIPDHQKEIQKCFQNHALLSSVTKSSTFQIDQLKKVPGARWSSLDQVNVHYQKRGQKFRISIIKESPLKKQIRLFKEDRDGLPTRLPLPPEWNDMKSAEILRNIKKESTVTHLQKKMLWEIDKNTRLSFDEENGKVQDLMVFFKDQENKNHALGCHNEESSASPTLSCQCL